MVAIVYQWVEAELPIKRPRRFVDGDHFDGMDPDLTSRASCSGERIHQQGFSQTLTGRGPINRQPAQMGDRNGVARQTLAQLLRHMLKRHSTRGERVVAANDPRTRRIHGHEVLADSRSFVLAREATEIFIEFRDTAVKGLAIMALAQLLDWPGAIRHLDDGNARRPP